MNNFQSVLWLVIRRFQVMLTLEGLRSLRLWKVLPAKFPKASENDIEVVQAFVIAGI